MKRKILVTLVVLCSLLLAAELAFVGYMHLSSAPEETQPPQTTAAPVETTTAPTETEPTEAPTTVPETTEAPTEAPTTAPTETEPKEQRFVLTFTGDCTLGSDPNDFASQHSFVGTVGTDYGFPFRNVAEYFENDDFTMINLEVVLADKGQRDWSKTFNFRGPTAYTQILTGSSVEAVTLANNHTMDFGKDGYAATKQALEGAGVEYVEENKTRIVTTDSGLVIGLYADSFYLNNEDIRKNIAQLKSDGAEVIICAFHWGKEGSYRPTGDQQAFAKAAIDAGADIVYGHHPHVLQKIEEYNDGIIYYSLGNFSFGGNNFPRDLDSAVLQQEIIRDIDGSVRLGELTIIPVSITSLPVQNNFQPTPCEEGSERYDRVLSKLDGTFTGPDLVVDYSFLNPTDPPEKPTEAPTEGTTTPPATEAPDAPPATEAPDAPPATEAPDAPPATEAPAAPPATEAPAAPPATEAPAAPPATEAPAAPPATQPPAAPPADGGDAGAGGEA